MVTLCREFVAIAGTRGDPVEDALGVPVEIAQPFGLQAIGEHVYTSFIVFHPVSVFPRHGGIGQ
jgi:hypothetical protein